MPALRISPPLRRLAGGFLLFVSLILPAVSWTAEPPVSGFFFHTWKTDDGLPENSVSAILQTRDGYLWLATYAGLARFDGARFTIFNSANTPGLQSDRLTSLFEDKEGNLWIGHERGDLTRYHAGKFEALDIRDHSTRRKISAITADQTGDIWMLNEEGTMIRVRDGARCALPNENGVAALAQDVSGQIWVASGGKLAPLINGQLAPLDPTNGFIGYYVQGICASRDGGLWIASDGRVRKWKSNQWVADFGTNPCVTAITAMVETQSGGLAFGAVESGLYLVSAKNKLQHFSRAEEFPDDWIRCLCVDREGTLWVGAGNGGCIALRSSRVEVFAPADHWQGRVPLSTTSTHDGSIWVATEGAGLYQFLNGVWNHFGESAGLSNQFVWCVSEDAKNQLWAGTWRGGMFVRKDGRFAVPQGLENLTVPMPAILHGHDGATWIGTASGLLRYDNGAVKWFGDKEGFKLPDVRAIVETADGTIWFGTLGGGLGRLQNGVVKYFGKADGLPSDFIQSLHASGDGALWIGTYGGGLGRFKNGRFDIITSQAGLPDNFICDIEEDGHDNFWISSRNGIFRVAQKSLDDFFAGRSGFLHCQLFDKGEGMPTVECSGGFQPAACKSADGRIWFPTSKGIVVVNPDQSRQVHWPVPVVIEEKLAGNQALPAGSPAKIPPGWQRFEFHYTGLSFIAPEKIQFQCRLDGWDKGWVDAGIKRVAEYNYLPPGNYLFRVRASNNDGIWGNEEAQFAFTVQPHFWQTWWFYVLAALLAVALVTRIVWFVSRRRMRRKLEAAERQQAVERERTRIAKDIHDHLGANLTRISLLSQSAHGDLENPAQAAVQLERIYDTSRELTRSMDEIVWAVNPQHDTLDSLASYLGNFAQEYLVPLNIRCRLEVPLHLPHWPITAEMRHNVFLAFKEALHNAVKHSAADEVSISLATTAVGFNLIICENGCGFDPGAVPERPGRGNGLKNMRQRLEKLGGQCEVQSTPGAGTEIKFLIRVPMSAQKSLQKSASSQRVVN